MKNNIKEKLNKIIRDLQNITEEIDSKKHQFNNIEELYKYIEPIIANYKGKKVWMGLQKERSLISLKISDAYIIEYSDQNQEREKLNLILTISDKYNNVFFDEENSTNGGFEKYIFFYSKAKRVSSMET
jgi:hypothetical protein